MTVEGERRLLGGRYELRERIACGGMGEVWRGQDVVLRRPVAVKVLRSEYADDPTFLERFRGEARHAASLSHPNIAAVLDYGEAAPEEAGEHLAYLIMELVEGAPLSARLSADGPMTPQAVLSVLRQTAAGLAEAHRRGVVHRDVKPANILVRADGAVKLTDFGIARSTGSVPLTRTGQVIGTAQYMSPEQAKGEPATPASDVYALGLVGYESLTGHAAFAGDNPVTVALKHVVDEPEPLPAELPGEVRGLIDSALAKDPGERIPDGGAFLDAVRETLEHEYPAETTVERTRPVAVAPAPARTVRAPLDGPTARRRALAVLVPLVLLLVTTGALGLALGRGSGGGEGPAAAEPSVAADPGIRLVAEEHVGRLYQDVAGELGAMGLVVVRSDRMTADHPAGAVLEVDPATARLEVGDEVRVTVAVPPVQEAPPPPADEPARPAGPSRGPEVVVETEAPPADAGGAPSVEPGTTAPGAEPSGPPDPTPTDPTPTDPTPTDPTPTDPTPTDPGATPTDPGATPTDPGATPTDPGTTPTDPGATPTDPGATPTDPGTTPTDPGTPTATSSGPAAEPSAPAGTALAPTARSAAA